MTVKGARHEARRGRLANSAGAGKQICVMKAIVSDRVLQRLGQDFLARDVFEFLRAPLAGDYLIGHTKVMSDAL